MSVARLGHQAQPQRVRHTGSECPRAELGCGRSPVAPVGWMADTGAYPQAWGSLGPGVLKPQSSSSGPNWQCLALAKTNRAAVSGERGFASVASFSRLSLTCPPGASMAGLPPATRPSPLGPQKPAWMHLVATLLGRGFSGTDTRRPASLSAPSAHPRFPSAVSFSHSAHPPRLRKRPRAMRWGGVSRVRAESPVAPALWDACPASVVGHLSAVPFVSPLTYTLCSASFYLSFPFGR